ncbi:O-fut1 [Cordylochernes scorpioides]|uniref:GDP-fucose protein O-fucosyltransferase 1 n=1 Tax=Cordylochernes scorpioides TaxID=51811 RepID=A0ABY6L216_9ARAC|nr:O-fut1 [Cordylochernes scorpioides]
MCPGRFGNQADHFLGALGFAKGLDRTLVLPPWVEYKFGLPRSVTTSSIYLCSCYFLPTVNCVSLQIQVPFNTYFKVEPLLKYHRVMLMEKFMSEVAPKVWPEGQRKGFVLKSLYVGCPAFCYMSRGDNGECNAKEGNPFGPFWDTFNVSFDGSEFYGPLHYDIYHHKRMADDWSRRFPPKKFPVLAFTGAPASFPVQSDNLELQQYLEWSEDVRMKAMEVIHELLPSGPFVGIHLRNGRDWEKACQHVEQSPLLFSAPQCLGYNGEHGTATPELCMPPAKQILAQLRRAVKATRARGVYVASDNNHMIPEINKALKDLKVGWIQVEAVKAPEDDPHLDLAILGQSNLFIGNCISSFTAFVKRDRDSNGLPSNFWAFPHSQTILQHDEF